MNDVTTPRPRAMVVYESMFGNTEQVAAAVARGLQAEGLDTDLVEVGSAPTQLAVDLDLLVVGGPTHAFAMSRPQTRADAVLKGAPVERAQHGLREWLESVGHDPAHSPAFAAFDTRVDQGALDVHGGWTQRGPTRPQARARSSRQAGGLPGGGPAGTAGGR